jgi:hypothetical protein
MKPRLQMLLDASNGGLAIGHSISADVSNNLYNPPSDGLTVLGDVSMNNSAYIANRLGISTHGAVVSLDISTNDALKLPTGIDTERPVLSTDYFEGFVRFNNNYFHDATGDYTYEGSYGTNEWKPLGQHWKGVIDTDGDTYISAETSYNFDNDDLKFYTSGDLRMTINQNGNMGFGTVPNDSSFNFNGTTNFTGDVSINSNVEIAMDVSINQTLYVKGVSVSNRLGIGTTSPYAELHISKDIDTGNIAKNSDWHTDLSNSQLLLSGVSGTGVNQRLAIGYENVDDYAFLQAADHNSNIAAKDIVLQPKGGNVGIGTTSPGEILDVNGTVQATSFNATSDARLKDNITPLNNPLLKIVQLQGVTFTWKKEDTNIINAGLIAQDIEKVIPEVVTTQSNEMQQKSVNYNGLIPYLIESVKTLSNEKNNMQQEIDDLKLENEVMKEKMKQYDKWFAQLMNK